MTQPGVDTGKFLSHIQTKLDGHVVGYSCVVGNANGSWPHSYGDARTVIDTPQPDPVVPPGDRQSNVGPPPIHHGPIHAPAHVRVTTSTSFGIASASKLLTALAAVKLLDPAQGGKPQNHLGLTLDSKAWQALPTDWKINDSFKNITFRQLLTHTSGLSDADATGQDYAHLQAMIAKTVLPPPPQPPKYTGYCNRAFDLFRILLPTLNGAVDDHGLTDDERAYAFAKEYQQIVTQYVFTPVNVSGPFTETPNTNTYAFGYTFPGDSAGNDQSTNPGDSVLFLGAGSGCWFVSIDEITPVLISLTNIDKRILSPDQWNHMQGIDVPPGFENTELGIGLGLDSVFDKQGSGATGYRWVEKNGGYASQASSVAFFGSMVPDHVTNGPLYAALFINSNIESPPGQAAIGPDTVLLEAFRASIQ